MNSMSTTSSPWEVATRCAAARISSSLTAICLCRLTAPATQPLRRRRRLDTPSTKTRRWGPRPSAVLLPECSPRVVLVERGSLPQIKSGLWAHSLLRQPANPRQPWRTNSSAWLSYGHLLGNSTTRATCGGADAASRSSCFQCRSRPFAVLKGHGFRHATRGGLTDRAGFNACQKPTGKARSVRAWLQPCRQRQKSTWASARRALPRPQMQSLSRAESQTYIQ